MKTIISTLIIALLTCTALAGAGPHMTVLGEFTTRPGNLAAAEDGTIYFSNSPLGNPQFKVMKLVDGKGVPYPNAAMSRNFAAVIGIRIEKNGTLWLMDMGSAETSPRLIGWDTIKEQLKTIIYLPKEVYVENSFLQDMAVDERHRRIYIADMTRSGAIDPSTPGIIVVNLDTGEARRVLHNRPFFQSEEKAYMTAEGKPMLFWDQNKVFHRLQYGLNPISIDPQNQWVYFSTLTAGTVYRIPAAILADMEAVDDDIAKTIMPYGPKPASDGMIADNQGNVYVTNVDQNAINIVNEKGSSLWFSDKRLIWPDGIEIAPDNSLIITVTQLSRLPVFNQGKEMGEPPYTIVKISMGN